MANEKKIKVEPSITKTIDGSNFTKYFVRVKDIWGNWYPQESFPSLTLARRRRTELLGYRNSGKNAGLEKLKAILLADYASLWSKECRDHCSDGWRLSQDQMLRDHILPYWGIKQLGSISSRDISVLMTTLEAKGLGPQTRKHVFSLVNRLLGDAVHHFEFMEINPVKKKHRPKVLVQERAFLRPDESVKFLNFSKTHYLGPAIWLGLLAGMRSEAIIALQWDSVDFEKQEIHIKQGWKRKVRRIDPFPKGKGWERIPIPKSLADFLGERKATPNRKSEFVAPGLEGGMLDYQKFLRGVQNLCKQAGVRVVTPHGLRHSTSELYVESAGASIEDMRRLLGQKDISTTARYMHRTPERLAKLAQAVDAQLELNGLHEIPKLRVVQ
jgi:integrase